MGAAGRLWLEKGYNLTCFSKDRPDCFVENRQTWGQGQVARPVSSLLEKFKKTMTVVHHRVRGGGGEQRQSQEVYLLYYMH